MTLSRQVGEAVRIRRRGQQLHPELKAEFGRCRIPLLLLEHIDEEEEEKIDNRGSRRS